MFPEKSQSGYNCAPRPSRIVTCPTTRTPSWSKPSAFNYSQHTYNAHHAHVVGADVGITDIIAKGDKDIGFLNLRRGGGQVSP